MLRATAHAALGDSAAADAELAAAATAGGLDFGPLVGPAWNVRLANGDLPAAIEVIRRNIESFRKSGSLGYASWQLGILAALLVEQGDDAEAATTIEEAATITSPHDVVSVALVAGVRAVLAARSGAHDLARLLAEECLAAVQPSDLLLARADLCRLLAELPARRGDVDEQRRLLTEALSMYREKEHLTFAARTERELARLG